MAGRGSKIRAFMVDVDGVLVRGRPSDGRPWATDLQADLGIDPAELHREFFVPHWGDVIVGKAGLEERLAPALAEIAPSVTPERFITYWFAQDARLDDRLLDALALYRTCGVRIYLATNQEHLRATYLMQTLGLQEHVDGMVYSAALGCRKPDRLFFEKATRLSGFSPSELLLIDDTSENVEAARHAGWSGLAWRPGDDLRAVLASSNSCSQAE